MSCSICTSIGFNSKNRTDKYDFLKNVFDHVEQKIDYNSFDDPINVSKIFDKIKLHCVPKGSTILTNREIANQYRKRVDNGTLPFNLKFHRLVFQASNGEFCCSCPSKALDSCPFECAFCPTASMDGKMLVAKSYNLGQSVFAKLVANNNNLVRYLLHHLLLQYNLTYDITKLAMRHLGGTFSTYSKDYRYEYTRDIFYVANIISEIIDNEELFSIAKKSIMGEKFDPDNEIIPRLRKPFNYEAIDTIKEKINNLKLWGDKFNKDIKKLEEELVEELAKSLRMEQEFNVTARHRIVSYSIETRPDTINITSIAELLILGVTIVELGLQSPDDNILKIVKRGHKVDASIRAIRMLKDHGLHVHGQWMFDLPGSTKDIEIDCINKILSDSLRCDQIKIYPHLSMPGTETKEWFDTKQYISWVDNDKDGFIDVMAFLMSNIEETTRVVRVQRDLPKNSKKNPDGFTNDQSPILEQIVTKKIYSSGNNRDDIRYHEPGIRFLNISDIKYYVDFKKIIGGTDIFISAQTYVCNDIKKKTKDFRIVWGYCRLRIVEVDDDTRLIKFFKNDNKYGRIRELKVNGAIQQIGTHGSSGQHRGIGSTMLKIAEEMAYKYGMTHVTVTSAVGVRDYYRLKHGYEVDECGLMYKKLEPVEFRNLIRINETKFELECIQPVNNSIQLVNNSIQPVNNSIESFDTTNIKNTYKIFTAIETTFMVLLFFATLMLTFVMCKNVI